MNKYRHIIWDWNGTLLDDTWLCVEVLNGLLKKRGKSPITEDYYQQNFGFPVIEFYEHLGFKTDPDNFKQVSHEFIYNYEERWLEHCDLHPQTSQILSDLGGRGISHSVLSAAKQEALEIGINHFGIRSHFVGLQGTDNIYAEGKIGQGRHWIEQLPWNPEEVVLIGDTVHDFEVSQAIGSACILLAHGHHSFDRLAKTEATVVTSFPELIGHFDT